MPQVRKPIEDALLAVLADSTNGFNAELAAIAVTYKITAFTIDWTEGPTVTNFGLVELEPDAAETFFSSFPAAALYTSTSMNERRMKFKVFSGQVLAGIDFWLRYRALKDLQHGGNEWGGTNNYQKLPNAVEDAILQMLDDQKATLRASGYYWNGDYLCERTKVAIAGDGHEQLMTFTLGFERHI